MHGGKTRRTVADHAEEEFVLPMVVDPLERRLAAAMGVGKRAF